MFCCLNPRRRAERLNASVVATGHCTGGDDWPKDWMWVTLKPRQPLHKWWANDEPYTFYIDEKGRVHC